MRNKILTCCITYRNAILAVKDETILFKFFPINACDYSTAFLLRYLIESGFESTKIIMINKNDSFDNSHVWLLVCGYTCDITCDQFEDFPHESPFVGSSEWHEARFNTKNKSPIFNNNREAIDFCYKYDIDYQKILRSVQGEKV